MRINFNLDQAIIVSEKLAKAIDSEKNAANKLLLINSQTILKTAISKEIDSNSVRMDKVINTFNSGGYTDIASLLMSAKGKITEQDSERKGKYEDKK